MTFDPEAIPEPLRPLVISAISLRTRMIQSVTSGVNKLLFKITDDIRNNIKNDDFDIEQEHFRYSQELERIITDGTLAVAIAATGIGSAILKRYYEKRKDPLSRAVEYEFKGRARVFTMAWLNGENRAFPAGVKWKLSERIWDLTGDNLQTIQMILDAGVGHDAVTVSKALRSYVRDGAATFAESYPNMMARMEGRVLKNLNYESLRLARNEVSEVYWDAAKEGYKDNPAIYGVKQILSNNRPAGFHDVCDNMVSEDLHGLGPGVFPVNEAPSKPHVQCLCTIIPMVRDF